MTNRSRTDTKGRTVARAATALGAVALLGACNVYACRYETRFIATAGSASSAAIGTVTAEHVNFRDYSPNEPIPRSLTWNITASQLVAQPTAISLRDARDTTRVIADLPIRSGVSGTLSASSIELATAQERDRVFNLLAGNHGVLLVYGGPAGTPPLLVPLVVTGREGWHRPSCD